MTSCNFVHSFIHSFISHTFLKINLFIYLFIYGCVGSSLRCTGFLLRWLLLLQSTCSRHTGFSSYGTWAEQLWLSGSRAQAQQLGLMGLVAPRHVGSSWTRAQTGVSCIGRQVLNHCATRAVPHTYYLNYFFYFIFFH